MRSKMANVSTMADNANSLPTDDDDNPVAILATSMQRLETRVRRLERLVSLLVAYARQLEAEKD
jgi:hypothetical protein